MPDLIKAIVKEAIRQELLRGDDPVLPNGQPAPRTPGVRQRFVKTKLVKQKPVFEEGSLPDSMEDLVDALAEAIARVIYSLQVVSTTMPLPVNIPVTNSPGLPSVGGTVPPPTIPPATPNINLIALKPPLV